mgnify:FL=1
MSDDNNNNNESMPHTHLELLAAGESLLAHSTDVGFFPGVRSHVDDQLPRLDERLRADAALVRSFPGMYAHVSVQLAGVFERSRTHLALVWALLRVDSPVHAEVLLDAEALVAELAAEGFFPGVCAVVAGEAGGNRERL